MYKEEKRDAEVGEGEVIAVHTRHAGGHIRQKGLSHAFIT